MMQPSCQLNLPELYGSLGKFHQSNIVDSSEMQHAQFLTDVNAIFLDMAPILSLTGAMDQDFRVGSATDVTGLFDTFVNHALPGTISEELDMLDPFSPNPLEGNEWNSSLELDLDASIDDTFTGTKDGAGNNIDGVDGVGSARVGCGGTITGGGPTLAELNYAAETLDDLDIDNLSLPEENNCFIRGSSNLPTPTQEDCLGLPPAICDSRPESCNNTITTLIVPAISAAAAAAASAAGDIAATGTAPAVVPISVGHQESIKSEMAKDRSKSALHALLVRSQGSEDNVRISSEDQVEYFKIKEEPPVLPKIENSVVDQEHSRPVPSVRRSQQGRLSTSSVDTIFCFNDIGKDVDSHDEGFDSDLEDSDHYDFSDADSENSCNGELAARCGNAGDHLPKQRKKERFFWQYNLQSKGPKGTRLPLTTDAVDPHTLDEVTDPVFSPSCQIKGIKHTGKARRGDGNDLNPNPAKLYHIGQELKKLTRVINELTPVSDLPFNVRPKSRKEKNKLASRACRLKKKAQHEANKLKLYGLDHEHKRLMHVLDEVKKSVAKRALVRKESAHSNSKLAEHCELLSKTFLKTKVAGNTADFVNLVLDKVSTGIPVEVVDQL